MRTENSASFYVLYKRNKLNKRHHIQRRVALHSIANKTYAGIFLTRLYPFKYHGTGAISVFSATERKREKMETKPASERRIYCSPFLFSYAPLFLLCFPLLSFLFLLWFYVYFCNLDLLGAYGWLGLWVWIGGFSFFNISLPHLCTLQVFVAFLQVN